MKRVNEIFYSLQGEGHHTGYPSVFVRFSGCNLECPFCDTRHEQGI
ncbi:MAG: 7-carboxy-7-deazaguanine synthase QueE, partial [Muribaculaceae bacterium]|nr:7-carboxy-7-deazaguanine synthase QueE [Muribaculaceae bacterium]